MESPGLAANWGLGGKPGGERGDRGDWRGARGGGVLGDWAAGTEGAGLGAALTGEAETFDPPPPSSCASILEPATHSVSRFLLRSKTTFPFMWNAPEETPSWIHCTEILTFPKIRILNPAKENF